MGKHAWLDGRQTFPLQGNCLQRGFTRVKLKHRPCREEERETVAEMALEQNAGVSPAAGACRAPSLLKPMLFLLPRSPLTPLLDLWEPVGPQKDPSVLTCSEADLGLLWTCHSFIRSVTLSACE